MFDVPLDHDHIHGVVAKLSEDINLAIPDAAVTGFLFRSTIEVDHMLDYRIPTSNKLHVLTGVVYANV